LQYIQPREIIYQRDDDDTLSESAKVPRRKYECFLRYDVIDALNKIYHEKHYVEKAILEKLDRDNIPLTKPAKE